MKQTLLSHLDELRKRLIIAAAFAAAFSAVGIYFSGWFIRILVDNLTTNIPVKFITTSPFEFITTQIKIGIAIGIILAMPIVLYHTIKFLRPALDKKERRYIYTLLPVALLLFIAGFAFAYFVFLRFALSFLAGLAVNYGIENLWRISELITTIIVSCVMIGAVFEMPLLAFTLSRIGLLRKSMLSSKRRYAYILIFVAAAAITPTPDAITMLIVAVPMILLYEVSMLVIKK